MIKTIELIIHGIILAGFICGIVLMISIRHESIKKQEEPFGYPEITDIDKAVLQSIPFKTFSTSTYYNITEQDLQNEADNIAKLKTWAATLPDGPVKRAYLGWADFYEKEIPLIRKAQTPESKNAIKAEQDRVNAIIPTIPKPPIP